MDPIAWTLVILVVAVIAFVSNRIPIGLVAIGVALALYLTGVLSLEDALAGFGDPTVLFIAGLFVVSESLDATGVTTWAGQIVIGRAGTSRTKLMIVISLLVAVLSAVITINGAVAALLPLVVVVAARAGIAPSKLLIPLAFAASAGSMLLLTGTPVNIIVSDMSVKAGDRAFNFFEFAAVGIPLVIGTVLILVFLGPRLLPEREGGSLPLDLTRLVRSLRDSYALDMGTQQLMTPAAGVSEVLVPPRSPLIGNVVGTGMRSGDGELVVLAVRRGGRVLRDDDIVIEAGDALLFQGPWAELEANAAMTGLIAVNSPATLRRAVPLGSGAKRALIILAGMVVLLATGLVPAAVAALLAAGALVLTNTVTTDQAYRSISWTTIVLIAGMIPMATAFTTTGAADLIAQWLISFVGDLGPRVALLVLCLVTLVLSQLISNSATVLITAPIAIAVAQSLGLSVLPFLMALTVVGAAAFFTPIATPANLMVMQPGSYRFGDYWKLGLPLSILFVAIAVFYVPLIWPF